MDEKLKVTIQKIRQLAAQNPEFESEMKKIFGSKEVCGVDNSQNEARIRSIEKYLGLDYYVDDMNPIIDYSFIEDDIVRAQLISDCREMMRFRYGTRYHEILFEEFCRYAQLQAEMLLNYFYSKKNNDLDAIKQHIIHYNSKAELSNYTKLEAIPFNIKLWAFNAEYQLNVYKVLTNVREVRNEQSHRSSNKEFDFRAYQQELIRMGIPLYNSGYVNTKDLVNNMVLNNVFNTTIKDSEKYKKYIFFVWMNDKPYDSIIDSLNTLKNTIAQQIN